jgi:epoxide hydrolase-like predicted phosphatase
MRTDAELQNAVVGLCSIANTSTSTTMAPSRPKVCLFDIGGVCVISPFKAILEYEQRSNIPVGYVNYSIRALTPNGTWHKFERGEIEYGPEYFKAFKADLENPKLWAQFHAEKLNVTDPDKLPPIPSIDTEVLYHTMMGMSRQPDPWMWPALKKLKADGRYHLAALSNTSIFPDSAPLIGPPAKEDVKQIFDVFVSSAHVGMRKPNRDIYEYTLEKLREKWGRDIQYGDIVFLDDIGENLKMARSLGIRTIRVFLGRTKEAVRELEEVTGLRLIDEKASL